MQRLLETLKSVGESAELEAQGVMLLFEPSGTDTELGPPPDTRSRAVTVLANNAGAR